MEINILEYDGVKLAEIATEEKVINDAQDVLDFMANSDYMGSKELLIRKEQITPAFFELKNGLAGEILQKFSNYRTRCAIIGDFSHYSSKPLQDFIRESNRTGRIVFVATKKEAIAHLTNRK